MPRYYFNIYNDDVTLDEEGAELIDAHTAHAHAIHAAQALAADTASRGISVSATASKSRTKITARSIGLPSPKRSKSGPNQCQSRYPTGRAACQSCNAP
jgi:hypothetical protein